MPYRRMARSFSGSCVAVIVAAAPACGPDSDGETETGMPEAAEMVAEAPAPDDTIPGGSTPGSTIAPPGDTGVAPDQVAVPAFRGHDQDRDGVLDGDEFGAWVGETGVHASWLYEAGGALDVDHVSERMFRYWDTDRDSLLTEVEWTTGVGSWFEAEDHGSFLDWDSDGDRDVSVTEVVGALRNRGLYDRIDVDGNGSLDDVELAAWLFDVIDADADGRLDPAEWDAAVKDGWVG